MRCPARAILVLLALVPLGSCGLRFGGTQSQDQVITGLREQNAQLAAALVQRDATIAEQSAKLAELARARDLPVDVLAAMPRIVALEVDARAALRTLSPTHPDARALASSRLFEVPIRTLDARQRFTQAVGTLSVTLQDDAGAPIATTTLDPAQLRDAYRSGFMGTHYLVRVPAPEGVPAPALIHARFTDALTAQVYEATRRLSGQAARSDLPAPSAP